VSRPVLRAKVYGLAIGGLGGGQFAQLLAGIGNTAKGIELASIQGQGLLKLACGLLIEALFVVSVTQAYVTLRYVGAECQRLLAVGGCQRDPIIGAVTFSKSVPVSFTQTGIGAAVVGVNLQRLAKFGDGALNVFRLLVLLQVSQPAEVVLVGLWLGVGADVGALP